MNENFILKQCNSYVYSHRFQVIVATVMQIGPAMSTYGAIMFVSFVFLEIFPVLFWYLACSLTVFFSGLKQSTEVF